MHDCDALQLPAPALLALGQHARPVTNRVGERRLHEPRIVVAAQRQIGRQQFVLLDELQHVLHLRGGGAGAETTRARAELRTGGQARRCAIAGQLEDEVDARRRPRCDLKPAATWATMRSAISI